MNKLEVMRKSDLFQDLDDEQLGVVEKMCGVKTFEPGATIIKQGRKHDNIYVVAEGLVGLILELGPLSERQVQAACNFETFGWSAMIEPYISTGTVKAIEKTTCLVFNGQELYDLIMSNPSTGCKICQGVIRIVANRLRNAYTQLLGVAYQD